MHKKLIFILALMIAVTVGFFITVRAAAPSGVPIDPADQGYCEAYGITFDPSQVEMIYLHPEEILTDPKAFINNDFASLLVAKHQTTTSEPLDVSSWVKQIERINALPIEQREQQIPYKIAKEVIAGKETFCKIIVPHLLSYLPEEADISTTYYLTALYEGHSGLSSRTGIITAVSHPLYVYSERLLKQGTTSIFNIMTHELFHQGYRDAWLWQVEEPVVNPALRELLHALHNEGMAVNAAYRISGYYPANLEVNYTLHQFRPYVRYWISQVNQVLESAGSKPEIELWRDVYHISNANAFYLVGGFMASRIEDQLGRTALRDTVKTGPVSFIQTYNSIADEGMELNYVGSQENVVSIFQDVRSAAVQGDFPLVRKYLDEIQEVSYSHLETEREGYLIHNSGYILLEEGHLGLAEEAFQIAILLFPQVGANFVGLGDVYAQKGDYPAALQAYNKAMELEPHNQWVAIIIHQLKTKD